MKNRTRTLAVAAALAVPLGVSACGSSTDATASGTSSTSSSSTSTMPGSATSSMPMDAAKNVFGAGCASVPKDGSGSFNGMATDPVATAASHNPLLKTLVTAVKGAGLVDTLNSAQDITVFAPVDSAFAKLPKATMAKVLADKKLLTTVLTNHVVAGKLAPSQLAGSHMTLAKGQLSISGSGENFTVKSKNGSAKVICGNVPTANATVYIIDSVLVP